MKCDWKHAMMARLWEWQEGICAICGEGLVSPDEARQEGYLNNDDSPSLEHIKPRARGGDNQLENLLLAHRRCNELRGHGKMSHLSYKMMCRLMPIKAAYRKARKQARKEVLA